MKREYYSTRSGLVKTPTIDINKLRDLIFTIYKELTDNNYFQEYFGYNCIDNNEVPGRMGREYSLSYKVFVSLGKDLWPFYSSIPKCNENELFDIVEFLFDHVSAPIIGKGFYHSFNDCGWHFSNLDTDFDRVRGQHEFRIAINEIMQYYSKGFILSTDGEIIALPNKGFESLLNAKPPFNDEDLEHRLNHAIHLFRDRHSTLEQRRDALRNLGDILERLKDEVSPILTSKDISDIFQLLNRFGIRHNNFEQNTNYDKDIFYSWMFYYFLASIHACQHLINRKNDNSEDN